MARIQPVNPAETNDKVREALEALPPLNIFRTLAHAETAFRPFLRFGGAVLGRMQLDPLVRELAILVVAREAEAQYEWIQHVAIAKQVGASDAQIAALEAGFAGADVGAGAGADAAGGDPDGADRDAAGDADAFDPAQAAAIAFARQVVHSPRVDDELFARVMTVLQIDLDDPAASGAIVR